MLSIGVNLKKVDYNRKTVIVHHVTDDVTGSALSVCGAKIDNLLPGIDADYILEKLSQDDVSYFRDDDDVLCERCKKIHLSPQSKEEQSRNRLRRAKEKEAKKQLIKHYEGQLIQYLKKCPRCETVTRSAEPLGFSFASTICDSCGVTWTFFGSVKHTGKFEIWVRDEPRLHDGKLHGHINDTGLLWEWRRPTP